MLIDGDFKFIEDVNRAALLYNLKEDPKELNDLAATISKKTNQPKTEKLHEDLYR